MQKKTELKPLAEIGRGYAVVDDDGVEIRISGIMGVLKAWLIGRDNLPLGNITGGKLIREIDTSPYWGVLITQSGRQMFYGAWREEENKDEVSKDEISKGTKEIKAEDMSTGISGAEAEKTLDYSPLPPFSWEKITSRKYPSADERVRFALSNSSFFAAFKRHGYYLFGRDGERYAIAVPHSPEEASPFPWTKNVQIAGEYAFITID